MKKPNKNLHSQVSNNFIQDQISEYIFTEICKLDSSQYYKYLLSIKLDHENEQLICIDADLQIHQIPFKWLVSKAKGESSNFKLSFDRVAIADFGQTLILGSYEFDVEEILKQFVFEDCIC